MRGGRVALFTGSMRGGGAERAMLTLATAFAERGVGVDLVLVKAEGDYLGMVPDGCARGGSRLAQDSHSHSEVPTLRPPRAGPLLCSRHFRPRTRRR